MATFKDVLERALKSEEIKMLSVNQNMLQVSMASKKKPGFVKAAVTEELAQGLLHNNRVAFILHMDGDALNDIAKELDEEASLLEVYCTEYPEEGCTKITKEEYEESPDTFTIIDPVGPSESSKGLILEESI